MRVTELLDSEVAEAPGCSGIQSGRYRIAGDWRPDRTVQGRGRRTGVFAECVWTREAGGQC